jgi:hypothetical protein
MRVRSAVFLVLLGLVVGAGGAAWYLLGAGHTRSNAGTIDTAQWEALTPAGAARASLALDSLTKRGSNATVRIAPGDLASYIFTQVANELPPSATNIEAAAIDDRLYVRALVKPSDLGDVKSLGPFASLLSDHERLMFGGRFSILRPGLGEFRILDIQLRDFTIPPVLIPKLVRQIARGDRPEGLDADALPLVIPPAIGGVAITDARVVITRSPR